LRIIFVHELPFAISVGLRETSSSVIMNVKNAQMTVGHSQFGILDFLCGIWLVVAIGLLLQFFWRNYSISKELALYTKNCTESVNQVLQDIKKDLRKRMPVDVYICSNIDVPMGAGIFHKRIYLPNEEIVGDELFYILKHEYTHFCNGDLIIKFLVEVFCCVFWWNPAIHLLQKDVDQLLEIRCDICVARYFSKKERVAYMLTILRFLKGKSASESQLLRLVTSIISRGNRENVKERFVFFTKYTEQNVRRHRGVIFGLAIVVIVLSSSVVIHPTRVTPHIKVEDIYIKRSMEQFNLEKASIYKQEKALYYMEMENSEIFPICMYELPTSDNGTSEDTTFYLLGDERLGLIIESE